MIVIQLLVMVFLISYIVIDWQIQKMNVENIDTENDAEEEEMKKVGMERVEKMGPFAWDSYFKSSDYPTHFTTFIFACIALFFFYSFDSKLSISRSCPTLAVV